MNNVFILVSCSSYGMKRIKTKQNPQNYKSEWIKMNFASIMFNGLIIEELIKRMEWRTTTRLQLLFHSTNASSNN